VGTVVHYKQRGILSVPNAGIASNALTSLRGMVICKPRAHPSVKLLRLQ